MRKYYELLNVDQDVTLSDLKDATREAISKTYNFLCKDELMEVCEAYLVLSDKNEKSKYDCQTDEEYHFDDMHYAQKKKKELCDSICDQIRFYGNEYNGKMISYKNHCIAEWAIFAVGVFVAVLCHVLRLGVIIYIFPVAGTCGFFAGFSNFFSYLEYKKKQDDFFKVKLWRDISLPNCNCS